MCISWLFIHAALKWHVYKINFPSPICLSGRISGLLDCYQTFAIRFCPLKSFNYYAFLLLRNMATRPFFAKLLEGDVTDIIVHEIEGDRNSYVGESYKISNTEGYVRRGSSGEIRKQHPFRSTVVRRKWIELMKRSVLVVKTILSSKRRNIEQCNTSARRFRQ